MKKSKLIEMLAKYSDDQEVLIDHPYEDGYMELAGVGCKPRVIRNDHNDETSTNIGNCILLKISIPEDTDNCTLEDVSHYDRADIQDPTDDIDALDQKLAQARLGQRIEG